MIHSPGDKSYREGDPEKDIWKCDKKMSMENSSDFIAGSEIALEKIVLSVGHTHIIMKNEE